MYNHDNTYTSKNKVLKDVKNSKERPWQIHKRSTMDLAESYKRLGINKYFRVAECGTFLEFKKFIQDNSLILNRSNFCKVRLCPMCSWRRSLKTFGQVSKVMDYALSQKDYRFIFLTLTCKNIYGEELSEQLDKLFHAFKKLTERKIVKQAVKGWFRALEVTHNLDEASKDYDTFHPHFHIILAVNKSYFTDKNYYLSQEKWTSLWQSCLRVDYTPIVDVRAFKTGKKSHVSKSVAESAKYAVKSNDFIIRDKDGAIDEELTDDSVFVLDKALTNRRLVAFGGELKEIHKLLNLDDTENGDLINTDNEELREDLDYVIERYKWHVGYKQYYKID